MVFRFVTFLIAIHFSASVFAQPERNQHNFAQTYFGVQTDFTPQAGLFSSLGTLRFNLGGFHFWKHADFYVSFPLTTIGPKSPEYDEGVLTGGRYLPLALGQSTLTPFAGVYWSTPSLKINNGSELQKNNVGIESGFYCSIGKSITAELFGRYTFGQTVTYPLVESTETQLTMPRITLSVSIKKYLDTTAGLSTENGRNWVKKRTAELSDQNKLSGFSAGVGISANIQLSPFDFLDDDLGFPSQAPNSIFPDFGIGYYFFKPDMGVRLSYRPMKISNTAYTNSYSLNQQRILIEVFKFLFDYKGFAPFLGLGVGADYTNFTLEMDGKSSLTEKSWLPSYALVFGWDIRPSRVDTWYLRTNLRYILQGTQKGLNLGEHYLEVNFIQFVLYPGRI